MSLNEIAEQICTEEGSVVKLCQDGKFFRIVDQTVYACTKLSLCKTYAFEVKRRLDTAIGGYLDNDECSRPECEDLHLCIKFLQKKCTFGNRCFYSHKFRLSFHNQKVLEKMGLSNLREEQLRIFFRQSYELCSDFRIPSTCKYFRSKNGCNAGNQCRYLHF